jgi:hypothetical protein
MGAIDRHRYVAVVAGLALLGCSGGDDENVDCKAATAMGAPPATAILVSLPAQQRSQLCDFAACSNGGYGVQRSCSSGPSVTFSATRSECLAQWPTNPECRARVQDMVDCIAAIKASPCTSTFLGSAACDAVTQFECVTFKPNAASPGAAVFLAAPRAAR